MKKSVKAPKIPRKKNLAQGKGNWIDMDRSYIKGAQRNPQPAR